VVINYDSEIHLVETDRRQRRPRSADFRDAWELMVERDGMQRVRPQSVDVQALDVLDSRA
jgi:hypothetical protein